MEGEALGPNDLTHEQLFQMALAYQERCRYMGERLGAEGQAVRHAYTQSAGRFYGFVLCVRWRTNVVAPPWTLHHNGSARVAKPAPLFFPNLHHCRTAPNGPCRLTFCIGPILHAALYDGISSLYRHIYEGRRK